jgi:hypothetical protein
MVKQPVLVLQPFQTIQWTCSLRWCKTFQYWCWLTVWPGGTKSLWKMHSQSKQIPTYYWCSTWLGYEQGGLFNKRAAVCCLCHNRKPHFSYLHFWYSFPKFETKLNENALFLQISYPKIMDCTLHTQQ